SYSDFLTPLAPLVSIEVSPMPIIQSLLDTDFYKFTMGHWVFKRYPHIPVRYALKNRTARVRLADFIDEAARRRELDHVSTLRLAEKIKTLRSRPDITFSDFGTRRRFSRVWQEYVVRVLAQEMPEQLLGTSNTAMAMQYGLLPIGTLAHEMYMVMAGVMAQSD